MDLNTSKFRRTGRFISNSKRIWLNWDQLSSLSSVMIPYSRRKAIPTMKNTRRLMNKILRRRESLSKKFKTS